MYQDGKHRTVKVYYSVYMLLHNSGLTVVNNFIANSIMLVNPTAFPTEGLLMMSNEAVDLSHKQCSIC